MKVLSETVLFLLMTVTPLSLSAQEKELIILHTNDMHSRLLGYAPESEYSPLTINDDKTIGGFARIATIIKREKWDNPESVLVVDAGDFLMGTFFHALEPEDGFQLRLMNTMGYDAVCLGNHEFDFGVSTTARIINAGLDNGTIPPLLLSNIKFNPKESEDDALQELYNQKVVNPWMIIEKNGLRIGLFGLMGYDASEVAPYVRPAKFTDPVKTAKKISKKLKTEEEVDLVICLSHSGVYKNDLGMWDGEDVELARKAKDIDIIISSHTHTYIPEPIMIEGTPIVQTGAYGANIGKLHIAYGKGRITVKSDKLIPINDSFRGDEDVYNMIEERKKMIRKTILKSLDIPYDETVVSTSFLLECDEENRLEGSNLGPFLADAIYHYINDVDENGTDVSMIAAGVIRDNMVVGDQTIADLFRIVSLGRGKDGQPGTPLARLYVTGHELKEIIEVLLIGYKNTPSYYIYYGGLRVRYNPEKGFLRKVVSLETGNERDGFTEIDISKKNDALYSIVANAYMLEFVGTLKKKSFGLVRIKLKDNEGEEIEGIEQALIDVDPVLEGLQEGKEWMALYYYVSQLKDLDGDNIPDIPEEYKNPGMRVIPVTP